MLVLKILSRRGPLHGYAITACIHELSDALRVEEGSLYPALHRMQEARWLKARTVTTEHNRRVKAYEITARGRRQLEIERRRWRSITDAVNSVHEARVDAAMSWISRVANVFRRAALEREIDDEISFHIESRVEELVSSGMPRDRAEAQARRQFGSAAHAREASREARVMLPLDDLLHDVRHGLRVLRRAPVFSVVVVLTLGLTIGANTAIFGVVNAVLIKPLSVPRLA